MQRQEKEGEEGPAAHTPITAEEDKPPATPGTYVCVDNVKCACMDGLAVARRRTDWLDPDQSIASDGLARSLSIDLLI